MTEKDEKKEEKRGDTKEEVEKTCLRDYGYSPAYLDTLHDTLDLTQDSLKYYTENTLGLDEDRRKLTCLWLEADATRLQLYELWCVSDKIILEVKRGIHCKQKPNVDKKTADELLAGIRDAEAKVARIVHKTRQHVEKLLAEKHA